MSVPQLTGDLDRAITTAAEKYQVDIQVLTTLITSGLGWNERLVLHAASMLNDGLNARNQSYTGALADYAAGPCAYARDRDGWFGALERVGYPVMDQIANGRTMKRLP